MGGFQRNGEFSAKFRETLLSTDLFVYLLIQSCIFERISNYFLSKYSLQMIHKPYLLLAVWNAIEFGAKFCSRWTQSTVDVPYHACCAYATSMTSVRPSVRSSVGGLRSRDKIGRCLVLQHAEASRIIVSCGSAGYGKMWSLALRWHPTARMSLYLSICCLFFSLSSRSGVGCVYVGIDCASGDELD